jgi:hypothetical protein
VRVGGVLEMGTFCSDCGPAVSNVGFQLRRNKNEVAMGLLRGYVIVSALVCSLVAWADDPPTATPPSSGTQQSGHSSSSSASSEVPKQRLDLRAPDVQEVMSPGKLEAAVNARDEDVTAPVLCLPAKGEGDRNAHHQCGLACVLSGVDSKPTATAALVVSAATHATEVVHPTVALSTCPSSAPSAAGPSRG